MKTDFVFPAAMAIFLLALAVALSGCLEPGTAGGSPKIILEKNVFAIGETVKFSFTNAMKESVFLPGCNQFTIVDENGETVGALLLRCLWEGNAVEVKAGETKQFSSGAGMPIDGKFRVVISAWLGCAPDKPISGAGCTGSVESESEQFTVEQPNTTFMRFQPMQCESVPWLEDWPMDGSEELGIVYHYQKNYGIEIISAQKICPPGTVVCEACGVCPTECYYKAEILEKDRPQMAALGWEELGRV